MLHRFTCTRLLCPVLLMGCLLLSAGCDSAGTSEIEEALPGEYQFERLRFQYSQGTVNLLDTLAKDDTHLTFFTNPRFNFFYRIEGRNQTVAEGRYAVDDGYVILRGRAEDVESNLFGRLLLPKEFRLRFVEGSDPTRLRASFDRTVNLDKYDPDKYGGLRTVDGTLQIILVRR